MQEVKIVKYGEYFQISYHYKYIHGSEYYLFNCDRLEMAGFDKTPIKITKEKEAELWKRHRLQMLYLEDIQDYFFFKSYILVKRAIELSETFYILVDEYDDPCIYLDDVNVTHGFFLLDNIIMFDDLEHVKYYLTSKNISFVEV